MAPEQINIIVKQAISLLILIFSSSVSFGQSDSLVSGSYSYVEQKGVHYWYDHHGNDIVLYVDTTITHSLQLDINHTAVLQIDTTIAFWLGLKPERKWLGKWERIKDTLYITFTETATLWPYTNEAKPNPILEKMTSPITFACTMNIHNKKVYGLEFVKEQSMIMYIKK